MLVSGILLNNYCERLFITLWFSHPTCILGFYIHMWISPISSPGQPPWSKNIHHFTLLDKVVIDTHVHNKQNVKIFFNNKRNGVQPSVLFWQIFFTWQKIKIQNDSYKGHLWKKCFSMAGFWVILLVADGQCVYITFNWKKTPGSNKPTISLS